MFTNKIAKVMSAGVVAGLLTVVSVPTVFAATMERPGYSASSAALPDSATHVLQPGQWDWYVFHTESQNYAADLPQNATIDVTLNEDGQGNFQIWGANNLHQWVNNEKVTPIGQGTENAAIHSDPMHYWAGNFTVNGDYYIVVQNNGSQSMDYSLNISSHNVDFPSAQHVGNLQ